MNILILLAILIVSLLLGCFFAWRCTHCLKFWAYIDLFWVSCWILAAFLTVYDYSKAVQKVDRYAKLEYLSSIQDKIKFNVFNLNKKCSVASALKPDTQFCKAVENLSLSLTQTRLRDADASRSKKEFDALSISSELSQSIASITFDLQDYYNNYSQNKEIIEMSSYAEKLDYLIKFTISLLVLIPFGLRIGKSIAEIKRHGQSSPIPSPQVPVAPRLVISEIYLRLGFRGRK